MRPLRVAAVAFTVGVTVGATMIPAVTHVEYQTVVRQQYLPAMGTGLTWAEAQEWATPFADSLVDWEALEADTDCLWEFLQAAGVEITLDVVLAAGTWADARGGACQLIGEDDE
jgi:hypothetical protein